MLTESTLPRLCQTKGVQAGGNAGQNLILRITGFADRSSRAERAGCAALAVGDARRASDAGRHCGYPLPDSICAFAGAAAYGSPGRLLGGVRCDRCGYRAARGSPGVAPLPAVACAGACRLSHDDHGGCRAGVVGRCGLHCGCGARCGHAPVPPNDGVDDRDDHCASGDRGGARVCFRVCGPRGDDVAGDCAVSPCATYPDDGRGDRRGSSHAAGCWCWNNHRIHARIRRHDSKGRDSNHLNQLAAVSSGPSGALIISWSSSRSAA